MLKNFIKKYQIHFYLFALILISIILSLWTPLERISSVGSPEKAQFFQSLNTLLRIPRFKLNTSLYLYYLYVFIAAILFHLLAKKWQPIWLLLISMVFLAFWDIFFLLVLITVTGIAYFFGIQIENIKHKAESKVGLLLSIGIIICIVVLFGFKYGSQFSNMLSFRLLMPLGISYYTFQAISYLIDIYSDKTTAERNFWFFAVYMSFFPKLFVGPIERAEPFIEQLRDGIAFNYETFLFGVVRIFWGLFKKLMVVNRLFVITEKVFSTPDKFSGVELWVGMCLFGFYIYFDFSAFIDIVIGSSQLFGFRLTENFKHPYLATSIADFWRRWHISLSSWLRDYIFLPLNFSTRRISGKIAQYINITLTFLICGVWHGTSANFILWGGLLGFFQVIEDLFKTISARITKKTGINLKFSRTLSIMLTFIAVNLSWVIFRSGSLINARNIFQLMFAGKDFFSFNVATFGLNKIDFWIAQHLIFILIGIEIIEENKQINILNIFQKQGLPFRWLIYLITLFVMIIFGYYGNNSVAFDPFYMQF
jgi:alginate O-acetyltransferase complex protein AlgI